MVKSRILGTKDVPWREIQPLQPENFKHIYNYGHLEESIRKHGFSMPFFVWEKDGVLYSIDGVTRKEVLSNMEDVPELLPATFINAENRKEAIKILLDVFNQRENPVDSVALEQWLSVEELTVEDVKIESLNLISVDEVNEDEEGGGSEKEEKKIWVPDCLFPSNNQYESPTLLMHKENFYMEMPLKPWGAEARSKQNVNTYHFYVDDYRFENIWNDPSKIIQSGCKAIVEPNLSVYETTPLSYGIFLIYKKRWIARFLQDYNINVFVDLNVNEKFMPFNMLGVPEGYNAFFTRGYENRIKALQYEYDVAKKISGRDNPNFIVYGGSKNVKEFVAKNNLVYINNTTLDI